MSLVRGVENEDRMCYSDNMIVADNVEIGISNVFQHDTIWTERKIC